MSVPILQQKYTGQGPKRLGLKHPSIAPYGEFITSDKKSIVISIQNEREWKVFCREILGNESLSSDSRFNTNNLRVKNRTELEQTILTAFAKYTAEAMVQKLRAAAVAYGRVNLTEDLVDHPLVRYTPVRTPGGEVNIIAPPIVFDDAAAVLGPVPDIGEHTERVMAEFALAMDADDRRAE
jgi:crotonobetainyl-CoA:carnitine CoA-transferase CaiB-like acyl-CoA transferase